MAQRGRPRDLYDIVNLFRRNDLRMYPDAIRSALVEKCAAKSIAVPTAADFVRSPLLVELESEWGNMLGHQLPALPPLAPFLEELPVLFAWLDGEVEEAAAGVIAYARDEDQSWSPPPSVATWRAGCPWRPYASRPRTTSCRAGLRRPDSSHRAVLPSPHPCWQPDPSCRACRRERPSSVPRGEDPRPAHDHDAVSPAVPDRVLFPRATARATAVPDPRPAGEPGDGLAFVADDRVLVRVHPLRPPICPQDAQLFASSTQRREWLPLQGPFRPLRRDEVLTWRPEPRPAPRAAIRRCCRHRPAQGRLRDTALRTSRSSG